ncbi:MAG TPA: hypothetical protein VF148_16210 [Acidimicrobiia bacterium]
MSRISRSGISVDIPQGWEGSIDGDGFEQLSSGATRPTLLHVASFPMPPERGSFGSGATELMSTDDVFMVLFEYGPDSVGAPLFAEQGLPRSVSPDDFSRDALQHAVTGQSGMQRFFTENGRAFCLYVVLGSHLDRPELVTRVNTVLQTVEIS